MIFALGGTKWVWIAPCERMRRLTSSVALIPSTNVTGSTTAGQDGSTASQVNTSNLCATSCREDHEDTLTNRLYIALSFGFSLAVNAWIFFRVSGGLFNPAVSLGMVLVGALTPLRGALLTFSQILGGITVSCSAPHLQGAMLLICRARLSSRRSLQAHSTCGPPSLAGPASFRDCSSRCS